jgi:3-oxoacyl-[acyl-carrier-protein] synthase II
MLLAMDQRLIPPTAGTKVIDPEFDIDLVVGSPRSWEPAPSISNSLGFGGHNGSIILGPV